MPTPPAKDKEKPMRSSGSSALLEVIAGSPKLKPRFAHSPSSAKLTGSNQDAIQKNKAASDFEAKFKHAVRPPFFILHFHFPRLTILYRR